MIRENKILRWHQPSVLFAVLVMISTMLIISTNASADWQLEKAQIIVPSDGQLGDQFGSSVAIDGRIAVVGANQKFTDRAGVAYVLKQRENGDWLLDQKLFADDRMAGDNFGFSVAINNGIIAIGAPGAANGGAAYIFELGDNKKFTQTTKVLGKTTKPGNAGIGRFGESIAIEGHLLAIGSFGDDVPTQKFAGSVHVYVRIDANNWEHVGRPVGFPAQYGAKVGISVAIAGNRVAIGADGFGQEGGTLGAVYMYRYIPATGHFKIEGRLLPSGDEVDSYFGKSVDLTNDTLIVGEPGIKIGSATIFERNSDNVWLKTQKLEPPDPKGDERFGTSVAIQGNFALVGAPKRGWQETESNGAAYLYERDGLGIWTLKARLEREGTPLGGELGWRVDIDDEYIVAGVPSDNKGIGSAFFQNVLKRCRCSE